MASPALSIFYPAHNEGENLEALIAESERFIQKFGNSVEVIVVDDGSRDNTVEVMTRLQKKYSFLRHVRHELNQGYGGALRSGFAQAKAPLVFFTDGDNQFKLDELHEFLELLVREKADVVVGYRRDRQDNAVRKLNGKLWGLLVWALLGVRQRDLDCAYKLFRRSSLEALSFTTTGAMISAELMFQLHQKKLKILEHPVNHYPRTHGNPTGAKMSVILKAFRELFSFFFAQKLLKTRNG